MISRVAFLSWSVCGLVSVASLFAAGGDFRLAQAVEKQDKETVRSLLKQRVDVNAHEPGGAPALIWAAHWDDLETAELLLAAGADVNASSVFGDTALWEACNNGSAAMVEKLTKAHANVNGPLLRAGETALMRCARTGNVDTVRLLLASGADVNAKEKDRGQTALMWALEEGHREVVRVLVEHGADVQAKTKGGFTPFLYAARQGDVDSGRLLLEKGAEIDQPGPGGLNPLLLATDSGREAFAIFLLDKGANANAKDSDGLTALHYSMRKGISILRGGTDNENNTDQGYLFRPDMSVLIQALLDHGANPNARVTKSLRRLGVNDRPMMSLAGATPFFLAAATADIRVMRALLAKGADPKLTTSDHTTPLMVVAGVGRWRGDPRPKAEAKQALEAVKLLVELGADVNAASDDTVTNIPGAGMTAMHGAAYTAADDIIQFLAEKGANLEAQDYFGMTPLSIAEGDPNGLMPDFSEAKKHESSAILIRKLLGRNTVAADRKQVAGVENSTSR
jgi:ankyrin repeat protein